MATQKYRNNEQHLIENYNLARSENFKGWVIHHRLEFTLNGEYAHNVDELKRLGMYFKRPYFELIYMKVSDHIRLHSIGNTKRLGKPHSEETRKTISNSLKGHGISNEQRNKMSEKNRRNMEIAVQKYMAYKNEGGVLGWNEFRKYYKL